MGQNFLHVFLWHLVGFDVSDSLYFKPIGILFLYLIMKIRKLNNGNVLVTN